MHDPILRPEMEQFEKRVGEGFTHLNKGMDSIQEAITLLTRSMVDIKITQESVVTSMQEQEKILAKVTDTEERCTHIERDVDSLKSAVALISTRLTEDANDKKDNAKWKKRLSVTTILGLMTTSVGLIIKDLLF